MSDSTAPPTAAVWLSRPGVFLRNYFFSGSTAPPMAAVWLSRPAYLIHAWFSTVRQSE